jgi:hypothetical protein
VEKVADAILDVVSGVDAVEVAVSTVEVADRVECAETLPERV